MENVNLLARNIFLSAIQYLGFPGGASHKEPAFKGVGLNPGSGRSPGEGHGNPLQYSCLENLMDREAWWDTVHRVAKSEIQLKQLSTHVVKILKLPTNKSLGQRAISDDYQAQRRVNIYPSQTILKNRRGSNAFKPVLHSQQPAYQNTQVKVKVTQSRPTLYDPMNYTVHGTLQARILEWVAFPLSGGSSQPRD